MYAVKMPEHTFIGAACHHFGSKAVSDPSDADITLRCLLEGCRVNWAGCLGC